MVHLNDVIPAELLAREIAEGMIKRKTSPDATLHLYCYTPAAQYKNNWNEATRAARGLVVDAATNQVVARPFAKFFNYGDPTLGDLDLNAQVEVTDKMDGSLAILLPNGTVVSKGSFTSHVAIHATELYAKKYAGKWDPDPELTYVFEAIFPAGRIVLNYGEVDDLYLLGAVVTETGELIGPAEAAGVWPGPRTQLQPAGSISEALQLPPRENAEGMVLRFLDGSNTQVKIKQDDYKILHQIVTGTSPITLWEALAANDMAEHGANTKMITRALGLGPDRLDRATALGSNWEEEMSANVPDEFHTWMRKTLAELRSQHSDRSKVLLDEAARAAALNLDRKGLVTHLRSQESNESWNAILSIVLQGDGQLPVQVRGAIWKDIRPSGGASIGWGHAFEE